MTQKEPAPALSLEEAMLDNIQNDNTETRLKVYQELLFSDVMLALSDTPNEIKTQNSNSTAEFGNTHNTQDLEANPQQLNIAILANPQGMKFAAVFTSAQAVRRWRPQGGQYATMRGQDIFKLLEPSPAEVIVVNPASTPFITLQKTEFRQLAVGIVPKSSVSPVQTLPKNPSATEEAGQGQKTMQISFPSDVFNDEQKQRTHDVLNNHANVTAAAIGAIQPPDAPDKNNWIRTVFLRVQNIEPDQDNLKNLCHEIRTQIKQDDELFASCQFEVGVMPDVKFWESLRQNNVILFDKSNLLSSDLNATTH